jgi:hypothetical protein
MRFVAWAVAVVTLLVAGVYTVVSLARWEWTRALFFAIVFVAAEVMLVAAAVFARLGRMEHDLSQLARAPSNPHLPRQSTALHALRATRSEHDRFAWLRTDPHGVASRTNVFITLMVGGGVLLSGGAWLIDKIASRTVDPGREATLARQLDSIAYQRGLVVDDVNVLARSRPQRDDPGLDAFLDPHP